MTLAPDQRVRTLQALATIFVGLVGLASALLSARWPWVASVAVAISGVIGTLVGTPLAQVTRAAVKSLAPTAQAEIAVQAVVSMAPAARQVMLDRIVMLTSDPPPPP